MKLTWCFSDNSFDSEELIIILLICDGAVKCAFLHLRLDEVTAGLFKIKINH